MSVSNAAIRARPIGAPRDYCGFDRKRPRTINPFLICCYLYIFACYKTIDSLELYFTIYFICCRGSQIRK